MCDQMSDAEWMDTIKERIPDYGPNMSIYSCTQCGRHEPVSDDYTGSPTCRFCASLMKYDEAADTMAQHRGFEVQTDC